MAGALPPAFGKVCGLIEPAAGQARFRDPVGDKGGTDDLLKYHVLRLNEIIKKRGKKTIFSRACIALI